MGTLASELGGHAQQLSGQPRVYVDANVPAGLVAFMRSSLSWNVLFVIEHDDLRRARDGEHYRLARQLRRTLITLDRDYLDDRKFPPERSGGVVVLMAPTQGGFIQLLKRLDREVLRAAPAAWPSTRMPRTAAARGPQASRARRLGRPMIVLSKGDVVLPDRVLSEGTIIIDAGRIVAIEHTRVDLERATTIDATDCYVVPGFIDVHVHGVEGYDTLDGGDAVAQIAARLPRYGVTAFCPTTVACPPDDLRAFLQQVRDARVTPSSARRARAAGPPREQLHQPGLSRRAAGLVSARPRRRRAGWCVLRHARSSMRSRRRGPTSAL